MLVQVDISIHCKWEWNALIKFDVTVVDRGRVRVGRVPVTLISLYRVFFDAGTEKNERCGSDTKRCSYHHGRHHLRKESTAHSPPCKPSQTSKFFDLVLNRNASFRSLR